MLTGRFFPAKSVSTIRMTLLAERVAAEGGQVLVLCRSYGGEIDHGVIEARFGEAVRVRVLRERPSGGGGGGGGRRAWNPRDLIVPDAALIDWFSVAGDAERAARTFAPDVVLSSSTPHSLHWLGRRLGARTGSRWVADFRDPYLIDSRYRPHGLGRLVAPLAQRFERSVYRDADAVVHLNPVHGRWARRAYPFAKARCRILPNGFPDRLLDLTHPVPRPRRVVVTGSFGDDVAVACAEAIAAMNREGDELELRHIGHRTPAHERLCALLGPKFVSTGQISPSEVPEQIAQGGVLVAGLSEERGRSLALGTKSVEYLATGIPTLLINPTFSDRQLLWRYGGGIELFKPTAAELREAFQCLLATSTRDDDDPKLRRYREDFRWSILIERYYRDLVALCTP